MSPVTYRGRHRLSPDQPVDRLRGLLAEDQGLANPAAAPEEGEPRTDSRGKTALVAQLGAEPGLEPEADPEAGPEARPGAGFDVGPGTEQDEASPLEGSADDPWRSPVRWRVPWAAVVLAVVAVGVVLAAVLWPTADAQDSQGLSAARGEPSATAVASGQASVSRPNDETGAAAAPGASPGAELPASADGKIYVHVVGQVHSPGVVELSADARVGDAVEAAGGLTDAAVVDRLNLAARIADGSHVLVPDAEEAELMQVQGRSAVTPGDDAGGQGGMAGQDGEGGQSDAVPGSAASGTDATGQAGSSGLIDLNSATTTELETLPRVGPVTAQKIVDHREQIGGFRSVEELDDVPGIGPAMMSALTPLVTV